MGSILIQLTTHNVFLTYSKWEVYVEIHIFSNHVFYAHVLWGIKSKLISYKFVWLYCITKVEYITKDFLKSQEYPNEIKLYS